MDISTVGTAVVTSGLVSGFAFFWLKERLRQSIRHEYEREMAKLKSDLEFDLDRRKRLYEGKLAQYKRYFAMLDGYSEVTRRELFEGFQNQLVALVNDPSEESTIAYIQASLSLQGDLSQKFIAFKTELNGLRLEAGEQMLILLDQYVSALESLQKPVEEFMRWMNTNYMLWINDTDAITEKIQQFMSGEAEGEGAKLTSLQNEIFYEMRRELGVA